MSRRATAFTLVELLVVIGIIALLIAILLPVLSRVQAQARTLACSANLRSIGQASYVYAIDSKGMVPRDDYDAKERFWPLVYARFLTKFTLTETQMKSDRDAVVEFLRGQKVFHCPALDRDDRPLHYAVNNIDWARSAGSGAWTYPPTDWKNDYVILTKIPTGAGNVVYLAEVSADRLEGDGNIGFMDIQSESHIMFKKDGSPNGGARMIKYNDKRHLLKTPLLFFDGHVETRPHAPGDIPATLFNPLATP